MLLRSLITRLITEGIRVVDGTTIVMAMEIVDLDERLLCLKNLRLTGK